MVVKRWVCESKDWLWDIVTRCLYWDVVVVGEVDTSMALIRIVRNAKELALGFDILGSWNVLSVTPLSVPGATCRSR
jgi:hypothetical protein